MLRKLHQQWTAREAASPTHSALGRSQIPLAGVAHQSGTCRFGLDPKTSVLDENCKTHHVDNLYMADSSFSPSSSSVTPSLTNAANALRVGDHLRGRLGADSARGRHGRRAAVMGTDTLEPRRWASIESAAGQGCDVVRQLEGGGLTRPAVLPESHG
jgi:choline dehydrogenase-like flavoprotein